MENGLEKDAQSSIAEIFGMVVRRTRLSKGIGFVQMCAMVGISKPTLCAIEQGKTNTKIETAIKILKILKIDIVEGQYKMPMESVPWMKD